MASLAPASDTYKSKAEADADRAQQTGLLKALNASPGTLGRDECGAWTITGSAGRIFTWGDGKSWVLCAGTSPKQWSASKARLSFAKVTQDGEADGCLHLHALPTPAQARTIRDILGIRKKRTYDDATLAALRERFKPHRVKEAA